MPIHSTTAAIGTIISHSRRSRSGIAAASGTALNVTITGGTSYYTWVYAAVYAGVDQSVVYTDTRNYNSATAPFPQVTLQGIKLDTNNPFVFEFLFDAKGTVTQKEFAQSKTGKNNYKPTVRIELTTCSLRVLKKGNPPK